MSTTSHASTTRQAPTTPSGVGADLEALLHSYLNAYDRMRLTTAAHRDAIRAADTRRIEAIVAENQDIVTHIATLDGTRRSLVANAMRGGLVPPGRDAKLTDVAAALPEPQSSRLVALSLELRDLVASVQREQSSLRMAASALASHMQGLIQHVARKLSHAGTYSKRGVVEGVVFASALDIRR